MEVAVLNVHHRTIVATAAVVGALLDRLATADDALWPVPQWPPLRLDNGLNPGSRGGHGPIRYSVEAYEPGRRVRFAFDPVIGLVGYHELLVTAQGPDRCRLTHTLAGRTRAGARIGWPLAFRWLHDALIEDLMDRVEGAVNGGATSGPRATWTPWVRMLRRSFAPRPREVALPQRARLARAELNHVDLLDAWQLPAAGHGPTAWSGAILADPPRWLTAVMAVRNAAVRLAGLRVTRTGPMFRPIGSDEREIVVGGENREFAMRMSVLVDENVVTVATLTRARTRRGRGYLAIVRRAHPFVIRAMLRRAARTLAATSDRAEPVATA
jgi:hypothetical protein